MTERQPRQTRIKELGRKISYLAEYIFMPTLQYHWQNRQIQRFMKEMEKEGGK